LLFWVCSDTSAAFSCFERLTYRRDHFKHSSYNFGSQFQYMQYACRVLKVQKIIFP
jgi:hypothetical protein